MLLIQTTERARQNHAHIYSLNHKEGSIRFPMTNASDSFYYYFETIAVANRCTEKCKRSERNVESRATFTLNTRYCHGHHKEQVISSLTLQANSLLPIDAGDVE
ncbi:CLUMA_CG012517, isoform A [Clunio marinus]|uniref:CLUMA_CG012517, isoform A n=1 Tax=Clunio marinus TaxID=568069 RepID=A0A1J1IG36_9DIPT|nr:CLUMA_CG012517, isoform A [Clunio marinus]